MKRSVTIIQKSILDLQKRLGKIQDNCIHVHFEKKHDSNTGNYDGHDRYWTYFHCLDCDKRWTEDGSLSNHKYAKGGNV